MVHEFMIQTPPLQLIMFILLCYRYMLIVYYWFTWILNVHHSAVEFVRCRYNERDEKNQKVSFCGLVVMWRLQ